MKTFILTMLIIDILLTLGALFIFVFLTYEHFLEKRDEKPNDIIDSPDQWDQKD